MSDRRLISFVLPVYNEEGNIDLLHDTLAETVGALPYDLEFVFVNDGSADGSMGVLESLAARDPRVTVVDLSRNFGHQVAVTAGLDTARGDAIIIMDADMQDPPRVCVDLITEWEAGSDVVYAQRRTRQDTAFKRVTAHAYYRVLGRLTDIDIPPDTGDFRLIDRRVHEHLARYREHHRFIRGMVVDAGFRHTAVQFDRDARHAGTTGYPLRALVKLATDGIFGFSTKPLQLISRAGYVMAFLAVLAAGYATIARLFFPERVVEGWAFVVVAMAFIGGLQLIMLGILGSYIGRIYNEVKRRPLYGVQRVIGGPGPRDHG